MMNKKGFIRPIPKMVNFLMSLIVLATGGIPLLVQFSIIGEVPAIPIIVMEIITAIAGFLLLLDAFMGVGSGTTQIMPKMLNLTIGFVVFAGGIVLLLARFSVIGAIPEVPSIVLQSLLVIGGVILFLDGLLGARNTRF